MLDDGLWMGMLQRLMCLIDMQCVQQCLHVVLPSPPEGLRIDLGRIPS